MQRGVREKFLPVMQPRRGLESLTKRRDRDVTVFVNDQYLDLVAILPTLRPRVNETCRHAEAEREGLPALEKQPTMSRRQGLSRSADLSVALRSN